MRASANPSVVRLAVELLRDVIAVRACTSSQRLISLLMQPFSSQTFEPDPLFSEAASTGSFLFRLRCACAVLDSGQSQEQAAVAAYSKHLARWIENALRDSAVLLAGLPLPSVKSYQPSCFNFADYKIVQPFFREAVPSLLRGVCALCKDTQHLPAKRSSPASAKSAPWVLSKELASLSLGVIVTLMTSDASLEDLHVFLGTLRQIFLASQSCEEHATVSLSIFSDALGCVWKEVFCQPQRCETLLMSLMELIHGISEALFKKPAAQKSEVADPAWLEGLCSEETEGQAGRALLGGYALHVVAASMRRSDVSESHLAMSLEVFHWWLQDTLPKSLDSAEEMEDDIMEQALTESAECVSGETCPWLWLLLSPFPEALVQSHPALTLKHWKQVCSMLSSLPTSASTSRVSKQLFYMALISNKLCASVSDKLDSTHLPEAAERELVYSFALLVPSVSAMAVLSKASQEQAEGEAVSQAEHDLVQKCWERIQLLFELAWAHPNFKVAQVAISSAQSLLQQPACSDLCNVIVPGLVEAISTEPPKMQLPAMEQAWSLFPTLLQVQQEAKSATLQLLLQLVCALADFAKHQPSASQAPMARCLVQVAQIDQGSLKSEVQRLPPESQRTVQDLLRAHVTAGRTETAAVPRVPLAQKKIELKLKF